MIVYIIKKIFKKLINLFYVIFDEDLNEQLNFIFDINQKRYFMIL